MARDVFGLIAPHPPIIVPAVGGARADVTAATTSALEVAADALRRYEPQTVVLMSPHAPGVSDAMTVDDADTYEGSLSQFGDRTPHRFSGDPELAAAILSGLEHAGVPGLARSVDDRLRSGWLDHASVVPLHFLAPRSKLVVLSLSFLGYDLQRVLGDIVFRAAESLGRRVAFVASGDCSHRLTADAPAGYSPSGSVLDAAIVEHVRAGSFSELAHIDPDVVDAAGECGLRSFIALGGFAGDDPLPTRVLSYEGPWGVGYLTALVGERALDAAVAETPPQGSRGGMPGHDHSEIVALARRAIVTHIVDGRPVTAPELSAAEYPAQAGAFVSLHRGGELRGCIGTIAPTQQTLAEEVVHNAVEAALRDPRFPPLTPAELDDLDIKVDVLHAPDACTLDDLDPTTYGVIVTSGWRRGLLLPDLEGVDDVMTQVGIAMRKAGIEPGSHCSLQRFKVDRYT